MGTLAFWLVLYFALGNAGGICVCVGLWITGELSDIWVSALSRMLGMFVVWAAVTVLWLPVLLIAGATLAYGRLVYWWKGWCILLVLGAGSAHAQPPVQTGPLGLAPSAAEVELGRKLFFDPRLSEDLSVSCSSCHDPRRGWSDGRPLAVGIRGQVGTRHSPTIINSSFLPLVFWDGRTVENTTQALLPLSNPIEMGNQTEAQVLTKLRLIPGYVSAFAEAFGSIDVQSVSPITGPRLARAIAAFEASVVSFDAPIDRRLAGELDALTPDEEVGFQIFERSNCMDCHTPPLFTNRLFINNGFEFAGKYRVSDSGRFGVVPEQFRTAATVRAFKVPTLREIQRTAPYGHHGAFPDLKRVVRHYSAGGARYDRQRDRYMDRRIVPLNLTPTQEDYLVLFLSRAFASPTYPMIEAPALP